MLALEGQDCAISVDRPAWCRRSMYSARMLESDPSLTAALPPG